MTERRATLEACAAAAALSGLPSTLHAAATGESPRAALRYVAEATRAIGTVLPPGRPSFARGAVLHVVISLACAEGLARTLPPRRPVLWGGGAGLAVGVVNVALIGRRFAAIRALPLGPQLADNAMFGALFAAVRARRLR